MRRWDIVETREVRRRRTAAGDKFINNYRMLGKLGQGRFAKVKLCERLPAASVASLANGAGDQDSGDAATGPLGAPPAQPPPAFAPPPAAPRPRQFAMKIFSKKALIRMKEYVSQPAPRARNGDDAAEQVEDLCAKRMRVVTALDRVRDEIAIMRTLYHRNIVLLFEVIESEESDKLYMILELMTGGPCMAFRPDTKQFFSAATGGPLTEKLAKSYLKDVLEGLEYLHGRGICHRDIKPDNILLSSSGRCQLSDFGCAMVLPVGGDASGVALVSDTVGTFQFLAPECCSGELYDPFKVDIWAVGVVLFIFLTGTLPFPADSTKELFEQIAAAPMELPLHVRQQVRPECVDLLLRMLARDPSERIGIQEALAHPWLNESEDDGYEGEPIFF